MSLPKLELMAVTIGIRLMKFLETQLRIAVKEKIIWTDSKIVLHWIHSSKTLDQFVANRVTEIV